MIFVPRLHTALRCCCWGRGSSCSTDKVMTTPWNKFSVLWERIAVSQVRHARDGRDTRVEVAGSGLAQEVCCWKFKPEKSLESPVVQERRTYCGLFTVFPIHSRFKLKWNTPKASYG